MAVEGTVRRTPSRVSLSLLLAVLIAAAAVVLNQAPAVAAGALLHPARRPLVVARPAGCRDATFDGLDVRLKGWICPSRVERRGTIVFLHGVADNRAGTAGAFERFVARGFDVIAYDSRAHGESDGDACTYGYYEKEDLRRVIATVPAGPVVLIGGSLGAAVALQAAADEPRVTAVVAAEVFSDLETVARERAPFFLTDRLIRRAFRVAEQQGRFEVARVSPAEAARRITVPVLLIHGADDVDTPPGHSRRVFERLRGPKQLLIVEGARHNESLSRVATWDRLTSWIDTVMAIPSRSTRVRSGRAYPLNQYRLSRVAASGAPYATRARTKRALGAPEPGAQRRLTCDKALSARAPHGAARGQAPARRY